MKRFSFIYLYTLLALGLIAAGCSHAHADGRDGAIDFSDGKKLTGAISLTPGKNLLLYTDASQIELSLDEVKELRFLPEKEQMWEGFYFPDAGQATQAKTGEVYPIRYLKTEITLADGKVLKGHLYTTVFYVEGEESNKKIVVEAKQTGPDKSKLTDLIYPTKISFTANSADAGFSKIDLSKENLPGMKAPVILMRPDLEPVPVRQAEGKPVWTMPVKDAATKIFFSVEAADGFHVAWSDGEIDPDMKAAADTGLKNMSDFYDGRTILGYITDADAGDIFTLCMLSRHGKMDGMDSTQVPYNVVVMHWKYDPDQKKATLLHRRQFGIGVQASDKPLPAVIKQPALLLDVSATVSN